jgi:hypothetical protein
MSSNAVGYRQGTPVLQELTMATYADLIWIIEAAF